MKSSPILLPARDLIRGAAAAAFQPQSVGRRRTADGVQTFDAATVDSTGAFLTGELERLDPELHEPLYDTQYLRDIDLREDVTIADDVSSFTLSTFGSAGGLGTGAGIGNGKAWAGKDSTQIGGVGVDLAKIPSPLTIWALELKYTIPELASSAKAGRPIDQQKFDAINVKQQMDSDEQAYIGDTGLGQTGLVNNVRMTNISNVVAGVGGFTDWARKTPDEILTDFNTALNSVWAASAYKIMPERVLLPPTQFGSLATRKVSEAGNISLLKYLMENSLLNATNKGNLKILPSKWLVGAGAGGTIGTATDPSTDRMLVYTKDKKLVRFPKTMMQRTPVQYDGIYHKSTFFMRLGVVELVYPETIGAFDGI